MKLLSVSRGMIVPLLSYLVIVPNKKKINQQGFLNDSVSLFLCVIKRHWISINYTLINIELKREPEFFSFQSSIPSFEDKFQVHPTSDTICFAESLMDSNRQM